MNYASGEKVMLGDVVRVPVPEGTALLRVVMLGDTFEHLEIEESLLQWIRRDRILKPDQVLLEWIDENPFAHDDPRFAPVGNCMFSGLDRFLELESRNKS